MQPMCIDLGQEPATSAHKLTKPHHTHVSLDSHNDKPDCWAEQQRYALQAEYEWKVGQLQQHVQEQQQQCTALTTRLQTAQQVCTSTMLLLFCVEDARIFA